MATLRLPHVNAREWSALAQIRITTTAFSTRSMVQDYAEQQTFLLPYREPLFSCLNPLKPCQNQARLRPDGNKPRMPNDTDLTSESAHR